MIKLTADDGASFEIEAANVVRIRRTVAGEANVAKTRIDWVTIKFAREDPSSVANMVRAENPKLAELPGPDGSPIWFNGPLAKGPVWFDSGRASPKTRSAFELASKVQYVSASAEEVLLAMKNFGGTPLPIPNILMTMKGLFNSMVGNTASPAQWD